MIAAGTVEAVVVVPDVPLDVGASFCLLVDCFLVNLKKVLKVNHPHHSPFKTGRNMKFFAF